MSDTSVSLLERLRLRPDAASWQRLVELYTPLVRGWLRRHLMVEQDAEDVLQEVLGVLVRKLPRFQRQPRPGAFRRWLRSITLNCLREFWRAQRGRPVPAGDGRVAQLLDELADPRSALSRLWDREHDRHVTHWLLEQIRPHFTATTWAAFRRVVLDGVPPAEVAAELGVSVNAVFIAKSRVLTRLRAEGRGLID